MGQMIAETPAAPQGSADVTRVEASKPPQVFDLRELWRRRDLVWILALRDFRVRYRQAVIGIGWALLQPIAFLVLLYPVFSALAASADGSSAPAWLRLYAGLVLWQVFSGLVSTSAVSLLNNQELVGKVFFPRIFLPLSCALVYLADLCCSLLVLGGASVVTWQLRWEFLAAPVFVFWTVLFAVGLGVGLSALNAMYRDVSSVLPFLLQAAFFASPIVYDVSVVSERWATLLALNPLMTTIQGFRWSLLGAAPPTLRMIVLSSLVTLATCAAGLAYFARTERRLADYL